MSEFNFKSQVCTDKNQSERLLALGLKKETADMVHIYLNQWDGWYVRPLDVDESIHHMEIPAWSLHRLLLLLLDNRCVAYDHISFSIDETDVFTKVINHIEWLIKEGYFNKEYLV